ncbi:MAG TPA: PQQ-binding-like beta-propeller repeat protein, partial [Ktedonobacteraceae bacterium]|nr:PQQ-binding-like beta-propeller repeat protein [Ktedonobacteraceae bacterium]
MDTQNANTRHISRRKAWLLIVLLALILVASVAFYISPARTWVTGHFHSGIRTAAPSANSNAAMFGYDLQHTRFNANERQLNIGNVNGLELYWSVATDNQVISSPAVANGIVFIGSNNKHFYALDSKNGKALWSYVSKADIGSSPAIANGIVYVGSSDHKLYAFNERTGAVVWTYATESAIWSSPSVANGIVYVGSNDSTLYALDARTGTGLWSYATNNYVSSSPAVVN